MAADEVKAAERAASLIREFEGLRLVPYLCQAGCLTVGFGHRTDRRTAISMKDATEWLRMDLIDARAAIGDDVAAKCNTNQLAALLSFVFNVGAHRFATSTMRLLIMSDKIERAAAEFNHWNHITVNGVLTVSHGLTIRRETEREQFECLREI